MVLPDVPPEDLMPPPPVLRSAYARYAMSGTDVAYRAIRAARFRFAMLPAYARAKRCSVLT
eukprot:3136057-Rhodomonas_salina.2